MLVTPVTCSVGQGVSEGVVMYGPDYEGSPRMVYGEGMVFVRVCRTCGRFVKPDTCVYENGLGELRPEQNATCAKCGRTHMIFEGRVG